jgi:hypothetical protein
MSFDLDVVLAIETKGDVINGNLMVLSDDRTHLRNEVLLLVLDDEGHGRIGRLCLMVPPHRKNARRGSM